ncbi:hypothetical protein OHB49_39060 [Streptomyces sp. NBC_01717]|uniref:hypothetical protein n=1 Tax=Streptomyces sp. NBC_01717 TaxID=2975918 RepID=UPI002E2F1995|nr:hypothetical protein [Streptomyces sp. NBC_01717]
MLSDLLHPSFEVFAAVLLHERAEASDVLDGGVEFGAGRPNLLQAHGLVGAKALGAAHDPAQGSPGVIVSGESTRCHRGRTCISCDLT